MKKESKSPEDSPKPGPGTEDASDSLGKPKEVPEKSSVEEDEVTSSRKSSTSSEADELPKGTVRSVSFELSNEDVPASTEDTPQTPKESLFPAQEDTDGKSIQSSDTSNRSEGRSSESEYTDKELRDRRYSQEKRVSILNRFWPIRSVDVKRSRPKQKKRPSFVRKKLIQFEKELTDENIKKRSDNVFAPTFPDGDKKEESEKSDDTSPGIRYVSAGMACVWIICVTTGSAIQGLPYYLSESSWFGVFLLLLLGFNWLYAGLCFGWSWQIMEEQWSEYLETSRTPYQDIAFRAAGPFARILVGICIDVSVLGACGVYVILIAEALEFLIHDYIQFCFTIIIIVALLTPFTMFSAYRDMSFIAILDVVLSLLFVLLLIISIFLDERSTTLQRYIDPSFGSVIKAISSFSFAFANGSVLPTVLTDMRDRRMYTQALATGLMICLPMYAFVALLGYAAYGKDVKSNIMHTLYDNKDLRYLKITTEMIQLLQIATTFVVYMVVSCLNFEERLWCPNQFGCYRIILRLFLLAAVLVVILGVPSMNQYIGLVSATTVNLTSFIFPPIFYVCLTKKSRRSISKKEWILIIETVFIGISVGIIAIKERIVELGEISRPRQSCYVKLNSTSEKLG